MEDPFVTALAALFRAPGTVAALYLTETNVPETTYLAPLGWIITTRAIRHQPTEDLALGDTTIPVSTNIVILARSEVPSPAQGDRMILGTYAAVAGDENVFTIAGIPRLDADGLTWSCELLPERE